MKRIGIGFTAIIAILAMSFTFASKSGKVAKADLLDGCYTFIKVHTGTPLQTATLGLAGANYSGQATIFTNTSLAKFPPELRGSYTLITSVSGSFVDDTAVECPIESNPPVCCYQVEENKVIWIKFGVYTPNAE